MASSIDKVGKVFTQHWKQSLVAKDTSSLKRIWDSSLFIWGGEDGFEMCVGEGVLKDGSSCSLV